MSTPETPAAAPVPESGFLLGRAFYDPESVFRAIARRAAAMPIVVALLVTILASLATQLVVMSKVDQAAVIRAQLEKRNMPEDQIEETVARMAPLKWIGPVVSIVLVPVAMAILAALFFLAMKLVGSATDYVRVFSAVLHAYTPPGLAHSLAFLAVVLTKREIDPEHADRLLKSNIGAFLPDDANAALRAFLGLFDVFTIWTVVLSILGVSIVGNLTKKNAALVVFSLWTVWAVVKVTFAALLAMLQ